MAPLKFGEVPHYVHDGWQFRSWINRNLQLSLQFPTLPLTFVERAMVAQLAARPRNDVLYRQPARFPRGYVQLVKDPDWREKYNARWVSKRKAAGLPHVIHNPESLPGYRKPAKKPAASVRVIAERKTA